MYLLGSNVIPLGPDIFIIKDVFISDIGMTGPKNSIIGMDIEASLKRFLTGLPEKYKIATGECIFNSVLFKIDDEKNMVKEIIRISY